MLKIDHVKATPFRLPLRNPVEFASGGMRAAEHVLLQIYTDEGHVGISEITPRSMIYGDSQAGDLAAVNDWFAPMLLGMDPLRREVISERMARVQGNITVKAAVDIALFDIAGQVAGLPCWRLMGGYVSELNVIFQCDFGETAAILEAMGEAASQHGACHFKLKIGRDVRRDIELLYAARGAYPDFQLYVDANHGYNFWDASKALAVASEMGVSWCEEPCPADDRWARDRLALQAQVPLMGDESCRDLLEVQRELSEHHFEIVSIKVSRTGFSDSSRIVGYAAVEGASCVAGNQGNTGVGTLAAMHFAASNQVTGSRPAELGFFLGYVDDLLAEPIEVRDGKVCLPADLPGLGVALDDDKLAHFSLGAAV